MTDAEQREAARQFINRWKNGGDEKQREHEILSVIWGLS